MGICLAPHPRAVDPDFAASNADHIHPRYKHDHFSTGNKTWKCGDWMWCVLQLFYVNKRETLLVLVCLKEQKFPKGLSDHSYWLWYLGFVKKVHIKLIFCSFDYATIYMYYVLHINSILCLGVKFWMNILIGYIIMIIFFLISTSCLTLKRQFYLLRAVFSSRSAEVSTWKS